MKKKSFFIALYEPEIPQNVGAAMRTCACFEVPLIIIEPCGFISSDKRLKRAKMDYDPEIIVVNSFEEFLKKYENHRKILFTPHTSQLLTNFEIQENDILFFGRESNGVENFVAEKMDAMVKIPMTERCRSLNLHIAVSIGLFFVINNIN